MGGVGFGVVFGILSFVGFDAAATLGEETRNSRRSIPLAVGGALFAVGIFYVFVMYALAAGSHLNDPAMMSAFLKDPNPFITLAQKDTPWLQQVVSLVAAFGIFSCFLAIHNTVVRVIYAMGRDGVLPRSLGRTHPVYRSPMNAILVVAAFTLLFGLPIAFWIGPGATGAYGFTGAIGTIVVVVVYMLANIALIRFYAGRSDRRVVRHLVVPGIGVLALAYPLWSSVQPGSFPYSLVPWLALAWIVAGGVVFLVLKVRSRSLVDAMGSILAE